MINLLGKKIAMTQVFDSSGHLIPISVIQVKPTQVLGLKNKEKHGYDALIMGYGEKKKKHLNKPIFDFFTKLKVNPSKYIYEHRFKNNKDLDILKKINYQVGNFINLSLYENIEKVDIRGISKGKGFQGVIRRHNMHRGPMSHGSDYHRRPGSMGAIGPQRVFPGKKLPGRMGNEKVCMQNIKIIKIDIENHLLYLKGSVPGSNNGIVKISRAIKNKLKTMA